MVGNSRAISRRHKQNNELRDERQRHGRPLQIGRSGRQAGPEGRTIRTGYVEGIAVAADALWLEAYSIEPRTLYEKARSYTAPAIRPSEVSKS